jgi:hypothetical protein
MQQTLEGGDPGNELVKLGSFRRRGCTKRNRLTKLYKSISGMKEAGKRKKASRRQTLALAVGQLECCVSLNEATVLP